MSAVLERPHGRRATDLATEPALDRFSYDDAIVRMFATATLVWGLVAFAVGLVVAILLVAPGLGMGLPAVNFARLRPLHTNAAIFAFAGNAIFCAVYYSTQRLCKARMWSDRLSRIHFWGWQAIILAVACTVPFGITQSKEYAEAEWPIDLAIAVIWLFVFGGNFLMTLINRRERHLYVALWFYIATIVTVAVLHVFNNLVAPAGWFKSYSLYAGVQDAFMQWWYGHNAVAFFLTTPFLGLMYYFLPKAAERPVYSYKLSILHFWSLVFVYIWAGPHHLHYTALPEWASSLGMVFSLMLWMPSWGGMFNGLLTLRGAWHKVTTDPILKFFVVGVTFYGMATFEGPMLSIKAVNALSHYTDWTIAHVHAGALGWNGFLAFGMIYWLLPRIFQTKLWSKKLAEWHFWLGTIGILLYIVPIYVAGLTQGLMWRAINERGQLAYPDFVETVRVLLPMYWLRVLGGALYISGAGLLAYNFLRTWMTRPAQYQETIVVAPPLAPVVEETPPRMSLDGVTTVLPIAGAIQRWSSGWWHRRWERMPVRFTVYTLIAVCLASLLEIIPTFLIRANELSISTVRPYTPLELLGRDLYIAEGCYNCHSQMIRPILSETKRYGEYSKPGEFAYDRPFQWGSRRIGPDLAREGGRQSNLWHVLHLEKPDVLTPGSIMPSYAHMLTTKLRYNDLPQRLQALKWLGVPYDRELNDGVEMAKEQSQRIADDIAKQNGPKDLAHTQAVAIIAYMQMMGTGLKPPPDQPPATPAVPVAGKSVAAAQGGAK
jgi:cytochrome c oxidase cbb3-type subunit I/II